QYTTVEQITKYAKKQGYSQKTYDNMRKTVSALIDKGFAEIDNQRSMVIPLKETLEEQEEKKPSIETTFEAVWKLYPIKRGKGQGTQTTKKKIDELGVEKISRTIGRYIKEIKDTGKEQYMVIGSTFFNGRYIDYLDENFVELKKPEGFSNDRRSPQTKPES